MTSKWNNLLFVNYAVEASLVIPLIPKGTELDLLDGSVFISLVGLRFVDTRVFGIPALLTRNFDEVNLRFYVKRHFGSQTREGVAFIGEIINSRMVTWIAKFLYGENYSARNISSQINEEDDVVTKVTYEIFMNGIRNEMSAIIQPDIGMPENMDLNRGLVEQYWGYSRTRKGKTIEYEVEHPRWPIYSASECSINFDFGALYGEEYGFLSDCEPTSIFYCPGSDIKVRLGRQIKEQP